MTKKKDKTLYGFTILCDLTRILLILKLCYRFESLNVNEAMMIRVKVKDDVW
jgi:hypothetical protein